MSYKYYDAASFRGKTISAIEKVADDEIRFSLDDGTKYRMYHSQDCCESVSIHRIEGDLASLVGAVLFTSEEESVRDEIPAWGDDTAYSGESYTWTRYRFNLVDIIWHGSSNGYYSESVQIEEI